MQKNVGTIDRVLRILVGAALIAFALGLIAPNTGYNWLGWFGVVPILAALVGFCPLYVVLGLSTTSCCGGKEGGACCQSKGESSCCNSKGEKKEQGSCCSGQKNS